MAIGRATPLEDVLEKEWQSQVVKLANDTGWTIYHTFDSRRSAHGFPDLVLVRDRVVYLELKREKGVVRADQKRWLAVLLAAGAEAYLARPRDLEDVGLILSGRLTSGRATRWLPAAARLKSSTEQDIS